MHAAKVIAPDPGATTPAPAAPSRWAILLAATIIVLAALAAYSNSFGGPFTFDDLPAITENPTIRGGWQQALHPPANGETVTNRPLVNLSLWVNYELAQKYTNYGFSVWGYHAMNLTIHVLAGLALFGLVRRTLELPKLQGRFAGESLPLALAVALVWTLHPLQTGSVTYMIQRAEAMMGLFFLLTLYCFVRGVVARPWLWLTLAVAACLLGGFCKEVIVTAPVIVFFFDWIFVAKTPLDPFRKRGAAYLGFFAATVYLVWRAWQAGTRGDSAGFGAGVGSWAYACSQFWAITDYLRLFVWPHPITLDYGRGVITQISQIIPYALVVLALLVGTVYALFRWPKVGFLGVWFFVILAPSSSIMPIITETMAEHRMYVPLAAVAVALVLGLHSLLGRRALAAALVAAVVFGWLTFARNTDYRTSTAIWANSVTKEPDNARTHENLAIALSNINRFLEAVPEYETALKFRPDYPDCENNLGNALASLGRQQEAIAHYVQAIRLKSDLAQAYYNLGNSLLAVSQWEQAGQVYAKAAQLRPNFPSAHNNLANIYNHFGKSKEAIAEYLEALKWQSNFPQARYNLGNVYINSNQPKEAFAQYKTAVTERPDYAEAYFGLANSLALMGKFNEAIEQYMNSLRLNPANADAYNNLGTTLMHLDRPREAAQAYEAALRLNPSYTAASEGLAEAQRQLALPANSVAPQP